MSSQAAQAYDAGSAAFFVENLCQEADMVLRFGYALTLSREGANELVRETYSRIVDKLPSLLHEDSLKLRLILVRHAWNLFQEWSQEFAPAENSLKNLLQALSVEARATLILIDGIGLTPKEVAQVLRVEEPDVRKHLAEGRRKMIHFDL
jgi:DNA-directed RNA polymerase specialized sigma24 family protein